MSPRDLLAALLRASLEGGALILLLWCVSRWWLRMPAVARRWLWWLGSLRLVLGLVPIPRFAMSFRPSWDEAATAVSARVAAMGDMIATPLTATGEAVARGGDLWALALLSTWMIGVLISLTAMLWRMLDLRRQWRAAPPFADARVIHSRAEWALAFASARTPEVRVGDEALVPLAIGIRRPGILLPAGSERLSDEALRLVLAHELSHLRRRDPLLGCVPAIAEILFWFHPLARLSSREYLSAREELCDADALRATGASPRDYGELLLDFTVARHSVLPGCASCGTPAGRRLKRRLMMLSNHAPHSLLQRLAVAAFAGTFVLIGFSPVRLAASGYDPDALVVQGSQHVRHKPSPMSYILKTADQHGTRGNLDIPADLSAARDLERWNRTTLYFRFGSSRWITSDARVIAEVRTLLEEEDRLEERDKAVDRQRDELERSEEQIEARYEQLQNRKEAFDDRKSELDDRRQELEDDGKSTASVEAQQQRIERQIDTLSKPLNQITQARADLARRLKAFEARDQENEAEREAAERRTMAQIERIGRDAIRRGVAGRYGARGSSGE